MTFLNKLSFFAIATFYSGYCANVPNDPLQNQDEPIHIQSTTPSPHAHAYHAGHDDHIGSDIHPDPNRDTMIFNNRMRASLTGPGPARNSAVGEPLTRPASSNVHGAGQSSSFHREGTNAHNVQLGHQFSSPFRNVNDLSWTRQPSDFDVDFAAPARAHQQQPLVNARQRVNYFYDNDAFEQPTMTSIAVREASTSGQHVPMNREVQLEARNDIYLPIVNDRWSSMEYKKGKVFQKLVDREVRSEMEIYGLQHEDSMQFDYYVKYGNIAADNNLADPLNVPRHLIQTITWNHSDENKGIIALGRLESDNNNNNNDNKDIKIRDVNGRFRFVSRIQAFILLIADKLIIFDGWSLFGTRVLYRSNQDQPLIQSVPNDRNVMTFGRYETVHLRIKQDTGDEYVDIVLNPQSGTSQPSVAPSH